MRLKRKRKSIRVPKVTPGMWDSFSMKFSASIVIIPSQSIGMPYCYD